MIGSFGPIVFDVSDTKVYTFDEFKRQIQARIGTHELLAKKPKITFIGPGLDSISFQMVFIASLGIDIATELKQIREIVTKGQYHPLLIGEESMGYFILESLNESWRHISGQGKPEVVALDVSLKEYYVEPSPTKDTKAALAKKSVNVNKLTKLVNKIKTVAQKINLTVKHITAIARVALSVTNSVHLAARGINGFLGVMGGISLLTNGQRSSLRLLGLNSTGLSQTINSNPIFAVTNVLDAINGTSRRHQSTAVSSVFGTFNKGFVIPFAQTSSTLKSLVK